MVYKLKDKDKKDINMAVGINIRKYRELAGYTREALAEKVEITSRFVADIETGSVGISLTTLKKICEVLGVSSDRILWNIESELGLDERIRHIDTQYVDFLHKSLLVQIEMIESLKK